MAFKIRVPTHAEMFDLSIFSARENKSRIPLPEPVLSKVRFQPSRPPGVRGGYTSDTWKVRWNYDMDYHLPVLSDFRLSEENPPVNKSTLAPGDDYPDRSEVWAEWLDVENPEEIKVNEAVRYNYIKDYEEDEQGPDYKVLGEGPGDRSVHPPRYTPSPLLDRLQDDDYIFYIAYDTMLAGEDGNAVLLVPGKRLADHLFNATYERVSWLAHADSGTLDWVMDRMFFYSTFGLSDALYVPSLSINEMRLSRSSPWVTAEDIGRYQEFMEVQEERFEKLAEADEEELEEVILRPVHALGEFLSKEAPFGDMPMREREQYLMMYNAVVELLCHEGLLPHPQLKTVDMMLEDHGVEVEDDPPSLTMSADLYQSIGSLAVNTNPKGKEPIDHFVIHGTDGGEIVAYLEDGSIAFRTEVGPVVSDAERWNRYKRSFLKKLRKRPGSTISIFDTESDEVYLQGVEES